MRTLSIAVGGAVGALLRFWLSNGVHHLLGRDFPYGTLSVNAVGSFSMGLLYVLLFERMDVSIETRAFIMIGLLGAFTTFSTFSIETFNLLEAGEPMKAALNVVISVVLCFVLCWFGIVIGREL
ncbi:MAG: fluoride efflux transporter CrcB [Gammaproteobacteria bacterium]|nr:fluoride efflux transporter CrcB [Gammaproteobacteria bacterium]NIR85789.1 fluoride efflux transporter CrcB [Gammaproteobacteria bacterium]NIR90543.1 fluoride efflux transporter CrcB [Gammaproteobacteria bacterium]NIU06924.1 fluoride efflux transporter CrcB [Gammaproteobacteria bacterium]NIV53854.1 fluoride efflux transporter CrcB [Gammaproteobacteria bacterium]